MELDINSHLNLLTDGSCGEDSKHIEECDVILSELNKASNLDRESVNWTRIVHLASHVLKEQSKDLKVAGYLSYALFNAFGFKGLKQGVSVFKGLVEADYWEELFPKRPKKQEQARAAALTWLTDRLNDTFETLTLEESSPFQDIIDSIEQLLALIDAMTARFQEHEFSLYPFVMLLVERKDDAQTWLSRPEPPQQFQSEPELTESKLAEVVSQENTSDVAVTQKQQSNESVATKTQTSDSSKNASVSVAESFDAISADNIDKVLRSIQKTLNQLANYYKELPKFSVDYLYMSRIAAWVIFQKAPVTDVISQNPSDAVMTQLETLLANEQFEELFNAVEKEFLAGNVVHLGLQRLAVEALSGMEKKHEAEALKSSFLQLICRCPDWLENRFANGVSFADEKTKIWINNNLLSGKKASEAGTEENVSEPWQDAVEKADEYLLSEQTADGIAMFEEGIRSAKNQREVAYWRLEMGKFARKAELLDLSVSQLEFLNDFLDHNNMCQWEPHLKAETLSCLLEAHTLRKSKNQYNPTQLQGLEKLKKELCVFDPVTALSLESVKQ